MANCPDSNNLLSTIPSVRTQYPGRTITSSLCAGIMPLTTCTLFGTALCYGGIGAD